VYLAQADADPAASGGLLTQAAAGSAGTGGSSTRTNEEDDFRAGRFLDRSGESTAAGSFDSECGAPLPPAGQIGLKAIRVPGIVSVTRTLPSPSEEVMPTLPKNF
jgi:hypothetical protein